MGRLECHSRPGSAFQRKVAPQSNLQRCASAGATRPRTAASSQFRPAQAAHSDSSAVLARNSSAPAVRERSQKCIDSVAPACIPVRARVQYGTFEPCSEVEPPNDAVDSVLQTWKHALRQLHTGYRQLVTTQATSVDALAAGVEHVLPVKPSRPSTAHTHSSSTQKPSSQNFAVSKSIQRPATATSRGTQHVGARHSATCHSSASLGSCIIPDATDTANLALIFVSITAHLFDWAISPPKHDHPGSSRGGNLFSTNSTLNASATSVALLSCNHIHGYRMQHVSAAKHAPRQAM